jgi:hypothetical protein
MKRFALAGLAVVLCILVVPGIYVVGNAFMLLAEPEYSVPNASSIVTFNCTKISEGGNTSYCDFGEDWTNYYGACSDGAGVLPVCAGDFSSYAKSAARSCAGLTPMMQGPGVCGCVNNRMEFTRAARPTPKVLCLLHTS